MNKVVKIVIDIILYNQELYLSQNYILENCDINYNYIRVVASRYSNGSRKSWRHIKVNDNRYFAYDGLPDSCKEKLLPKEQLINRAFALNDVFYILTKAKFDSYKLFPDTTFERAFSLAIIHEASIYVTANQISFSKSAFFEKLANELELRQIRYLPKTWRNLRDKIKEYHDSMNMQI